MSITRLEQSPTVVMEAMLDGTFRESTIESAHLWRCDGCGLVWEKKWHAETCAGRGHVGRFVQTYVSGPIVNGKPMYEPKSYERRAVRRDRGTR